MRCKCDDCPYKFEDLCCSEVCLIENDEDDIGSATVREMRIQNEL